ncbi:MAG: threonine synthase [Thermodesulfobacteriota bacterium]|nr:threonine synthase [Desulfovibrionales bacterium]MDQ7838047.1 threonine synthase [Thermodesulfobacteriota bacterium]
MRYISTRGQIKPVSFREAVIMGLATDGGLLLPESIPMVSAGELRSWARLSYPELAFKVMSLFITDIKAEDLKRLVKRSYSAFDHPEITPVVKKDGIYVLELFHGPTLAFKDVALQFLGNVFEYLLLEGGRKMNILGATSGDTGSAAIYGVRGKKNINIFILHPYKRVSPIQELQMTTVTDANVFNVAIKGTFDDGQAIVKAVFNDLPFKETHALGAINSINWARVLAQIVYYFYAYFRVREETDREEISFAVPTGNFGDIFAGYIARRMMGKGFHRLVLATNENNILTRFINAGDYSIGKVVPTVSPSMDIQVASNFERYLYYFYNEDAERVREAMKAFSKSGHLKFTEEEHEVVRRDFVSRSVDQPTTLKTIRSFYEETGYILDPHTAVGVRAGLDLREPDVPMVCLATAHPAKFGEAVFQALGREPELPPRLQGLGEREARCEVLEADTDVIKDYLHKNAV